MGAVVPKRHDNWPVLLSDYLNAASKRGFAWGINDCCLFAANAVKAIRGDDPAKAFRNKYRSEQGAKKALIKYGSGSLRTTMLDILGQPYANVKMAGRGDIALVKTENGPAAGVVDNGFVYVPIEGVSGLASFHFDFVILAWKI